MAGRDTVENVDVKLTATDDASKTVDKLAGKVDGLVDDDHELELTADTAEALTDVAKVDREADEAAKQRELVIRSAGLGDILDDIRKVERGAQSAQAQLEGIGTAADDASNVTTDGVGRMTGGLAQIPGPIGEIGQAFNDASDLAEGLGDKVAGLGPILAVAAGAAFTFWNLWQDQADQAKKKLEEVKGAQLAMASGDMTKATTLLADAYAKYATQLSAAGISQADFANLITKNTPLTDAQTQAMNEQLGVIGLSEKGVKDLQAAWQTEADELTKAQTAQFEMSKALGATTDQLFGMAGEALPAVRKQILEYIAATEGIPAEKLTTVLTDADPDDVAQVKALLDELTRDRTVTVNAALGANWAFIKGVLGGGGVSTSGRSTGGGGGGGPVPTARGARAAAPVAAPYAAAAPTFVVNVTVPWGTPTPEMGRAVAAALDAHERRVGRRRGAPS